MYPIPTKLVYILFFNGRLTECTDEFSLYGPGHSFDERGGGKPSKHHVVQEHNVEVPQPVVPAIIPKKVKAGDP